MGVFEKKGDLMSLQLADFFTLQERPPLDIPTAVRNLSKSGVPLSPEGATKEQKSAVGTAFEAFFFLMSSDNGRKVVVDVLKGGLANALFVFGGSTLREALLKGGKYNPKSGGTPVNFPGLTDQEVAEIINSHPSTGGNGNAILDHFGGLVAKVRGPVTDFRTWSSEVGVAATVAMHALLDLFPEDTDHRSFHRRWSNFFVGNGSRRGTLPSSVYRRFIEEGIITPHNGVKDPKKYATPPSASVADAEEILRKMEAHREAAGKTTIGDMVDADQLAWESANRILPVKSRRPATSAK